MEMYEESSRRQKYEVGTSEEDDATRRRRLREVIHAQNQILHALDDAPLRLYNRKDQIMKSMFRGAQQTSAVLRQSIPIKNVVYKEGSANYDLHEALSEDEDDTGEVGVVANQLLKSPPKSNTPTADRLIEAAKALYLGSSQM